MRLLLDEPPLADRDALASLLWPTVPPPSARGSFRVALAQCRTAIRGIEGLSIESNWHSVRVRVSAEVDVHVFEREAADGRPEALARALALYTGDLLPGFSVSEAPFDAWLDTRRTELRHRAVEVARQLVWHHRGTGDTSAAVRVATQLVSIAPFDDESNALMMTSYLAAGREFDAVRHYQRYRALSETRGGGRARGRCDELFARLSSPARGRRGSHRPRLLVVEDDETARSLIGRWLEGAGFAVTTVTDGADAMLALGQGRFAGVVTDLRMPLIDGLQLLRAINAKPTPPPIVVVTAADEAEAAARAAGAAAVLVKPLARRPFLERVCAAVGPPGGPGASPDAGPEERRRNARRAEGRTCTG